MENYVKEFRSKSSRRLQLWQHNPEEGESRNLTSMPIGCFQFLRSCIILWFEAFLFAAIVNLVRHTLLGGSKQETDMAEFGLKAKTLATVAASLLHVSTAILRELHTVKGDGPWLDELHDTIVRQLKNQTFQGLSPHEEIEHIDAALTAVDALFSAVDPRYCKQMVIGARHDDQ